MVKEKVLKNRTLGAMFPHLISQWHPTKNRLTPYDFTAYSAKKAWWICEKDKEHEWEAVIYYRSRGSGCPYCRPSQITKRTYLKDKHPELVKQFHPTKNGSIDITTCTTGSRLNVWWICEKNKNHQWPASIKHRCKGTGCPYCQGRKVGTDNSLAHLNQELAKQWHPMKNGSLTPFHVRPGSNMKVWWLCENDHEWPAKIDCRNRGQGCPKCYKESLDSHLMLKDCIEPLSANVEISAQGKTNIVNY